MGHIDDYLKQTTTSLEQDMKMLQSRTEDFKTDQQIGIDDLQSCVVILQLALENQIRINQGLVKKIEEIENRPGWKYLFKRS